MGKYLDKIRQHERNQPEEASTQQKALDQIPTVHPGDRIEWQRADGTVQHGVVDYLHTEADGGSGAFVTIGENWSLVNLKYATVIPMSPDALAE